MESDKLGKMMASRYRSAVGAKEVSPRRKPWVGCVIILPSPGRGGTRGRLPLALNGGLMVLLWQPITDLPQDWSSLTDGELGPLLEFWNDQRADLEQSGALAAFSQHLAREWSIETGQIEGVYNLDRGVTQTLIEHGINADLIGSQPGQKLPELIAAIIQDHQEVLEGLFPFVKGDRPISKSYIHELHAALLRHQDTSMMVDQFGNMF